MIHFQFCGRLADTRHSNLPLPAPDCSISLRGPSSQGFQHFRHYRVASRRARLLTMASKLPTATVREAVEAILAESKDKPRNFQETIELQVGLKNYDTKKDKRFAGSVKLPHCPRPNMKVAILGNAVHVAEADKLGVDKYDVDALKKFNKQKKPIKKFAKKYNAFLASDTIIKTIVSGRKRATLDLSAVPFLAICEH